ncbi:MAG: SHOCT domain-containing protein [Acidimicrobiia bacterium]
MRGRRMGRPGLVGTMARTAVVAGTATAVVGGVSGRQQAKQAASQDQAAANQAAYESQAQIAELQSQLAAQQAAPQAAAPADDMTSKLTELASLHSSGVLSDEEFAAAKAKLLA